MRESKYTVKLTAQFKKDYKLAIKRGLKIELLEQIIAMLALGKILPEKNKDHALSGNWSEHRECHIQPDWLLIYRIENDILVLTLARAGTQRLILQMPESRRIREIGTALCYTFVMPAIPSFQSISAFSSILL